MRSGTRSVGFIALVLALLLAACAKNAVPPSDPRDLIELRWLKAYARESQSDVDTGLKWGLSLLGAELPADARVIRWRGDRITVDLARAQVLEGTIPAWRQLIAAMKASGEYQAHGALDVGRFLALDALVTRRRALLGQYRDGLDTQIEYRNSQDHTYVELLYLSFEEPSLERLAAEWSVSIERATELLSGKPTHAQAEFAYLGSELYWREDVEGLAPYAVLAAPQSVREASAREPDLIEVRR